MTLLLQGAGIQALTTPAPPFPTPLLDLEADTLVLNDGDPVALWADQSGNGYNFAQTGDARPTKQTIGGFDVVVFDGVDDWMLGSNFADNLSNFTIFVVQTTTIGDSAIMLSKINSGDLGDPGWEFDQQLFFFEQDGSNYVTKYYDGAIAGKKIFTAEVLNFATNHFYVNGNNSLEQDDHGGTVTTITNAQPVRIGANGGTSVNFTGMNLYAVRIYAPALSSSDRATIEAELATRYGITL